MSETRELHVLYKLPSEMVPLGGPILSFLSPADELSCRARCDEHILSGREAVNRVRETARLAYIDIVARISATPCNGLTLRQALNIPGMGNPWWYHPFSAKHVEIDNTFLIMLHVFAILDVARREQVKTIFLYSSLSEIADVLSSHYKVIVIEGKKTLTSTIVGCLIRGIVARLMYLCKAILYHGMLKYFTKNPDIDPDVVFQGFWDWSVGFEVNRPILRDLYFRFLPERLTNKGLQCCWFVWFDLNNKPGTKRRSFANVLDFKGDNKHIVFLQNFLMLSDILKAILDYRPLIRYICFSRSKEFRSLFKHTGIDFWSAVKNKLFYGFCNTTLPNCFLIEKTCSRAFSKYNPKLAFTFLELFLYSRSFYSGASIGSPDTILCNTQHASYNREKLYLVIDKDREYNGIPDMLPIPKPDYVFAMGELGREIFTESGFMDQNVFLTGSPRYDLLRIEKDRSPNKKNSDSINVLLVATLNITLELEMVHATIAACSELTGVRIFLRSHPFARLENMASYKPYGRWITSTTGTLEEDLKMADLIIFIYSTVAEEGLLRGIPVFQWLPADYNGSVFRDIPLVPVFYSVDALRSALIEFIKDPGIFKPSKEIREIVAKKCFYSVDGLAASRVADKVVELLGDAKGVGMCERLANMRE